MFHRLTLTALATLGVTLTSCSGDRPRPGSPTDSTRASTAERQQVTTMTQIPQFSGSRAFEYLLKQTSFGPRNPNSTGHDACLAYLFSTLQSAADRVQRQEFTRTGYHGEVLRLTNIVASFNPDVSTRILLCAHWDTRPRAEHDQDERRRNDPIVGANDGASGVAVLLEMADLMQKVRPRVGVDLALFDGEDYGKEGDRDYYLLGARNFAAVKAADYIPRFGILLDMVGDAQLEIPKELSSLRYAPDVVETIWSTARGLGIQQFLDQPGEEVMDDHWPLNDAGIKTVDLIDFNYPDASNRFWHTHQDTPEHCSAESLEAVGTVLMHVVYSQNP